MMEEKEIKKEETSLEEKNTARRRQRPKKIMISKIPKRPPAKLVKEKNWFTINNITYVDYKHTKTLKRFTNRQGHIVSSVFSRLPSKIQRLVTVAIKRAQRMKLMPYMIVDQEI